MSRGVPSRIGVMKKPRQTVKTRIAPLTTPGRLNGSNTSGAVLCQCDGKVQIGGVLGRAGYPDGLILADKSNCWRRRIVDMKTTRE